MIKNIQTIWGKEINIGDDFKSDFIGDFNSGEKVVVEIKEIDKGLNYQIIFRDGSMIETSYKNLAKIND